MGRHAQEVLDAAGITVNKNPVPFDRRGLLEMATVARLIDRVVASRGAPHMVHAVRREVAEIARSFPLDVVERAETAQPKR